MRKKIDDQTIYNIAITVFAEFGYKKTTLDDIAHKLHMTKSNLYLYARNKKDLYEKSVAHALRKWQQFVLQQIEPIRDVQIKFLLMCQKAVDYLSREQNLRAVLARDPEIFPLFPGVDPYQEINDNSVQIIRAILKQGIAEGKFREVDIDRTSQVIFLLYKLFIIRTYIKGEKEFMLTMYQETLDLITRGFFIDAGSESLYNNIIKKTRSNGG